MTETRAPAIRGGPIGTEHFAPETTLSPPTIRPEDER